MLATATVRNFMDYGFYSQRTLLYPENIITVTLNSGSTQKWIFFSQNVCLVPPSSILVIKYHLLPSLGLFFQYLELHYCFQSLHCHSQDLHYCFKGPKFKLSLHSLDLHYHFSWFYGFMGALASSISLPLVTDPYATTKLCQAWACLS